MTKRPAGTPSTPRCVRCTATRSRSTEGSFRGSPLGSPLQGASAYPEADHWHFVTYGLTELFGKESDIAEISGFGYELTMRVRRDGEEQPPDWPFALLAKVAAAARAGHEFSVGHRLQVGGPITGAQGCVMEAIAFTSDPSLRSGLPARTAASSSTHSSA